MAGAGQSVANFGQAEIDDFLARLGEKIVGSADDELEVLRRVESGEWRVASDRK